MKIVLKCLHLNNVLLCLASIIFKILSVAFDMLTVCILNICTCMQESQCLQRNDYFPLIFLLAQLYKCLVFNHSSRTYLVYILVFFKYFTYVNVYIACTYVTKIIFAMFFY